MPRSSSSRPGATSKSHPDTSRVSSLSDFYRARFLYRLSQGGEAVEAALTLFVADAAAPRRAADGGAGGHREPAAGPAAGWRDEAEPDVAKMHETLRDLVRVFESLAENAQAFMAGVARSIELQQAEAAAVAGYKRRLIDYLERFIGDLVRRSDAIARPYPGAGAAHRRTCCSWSPSARRAMRRPATRRSRPMAQTRYWQAWRERWTGLRGWFFRTGHEPPQAELLRARARAAIPQLLGAIARAQRAAQRPQRPLGGFPRARQLVRRLCQTTPRRTGWRAPRSRSIRHGISRSTPTRTPSCRPSTRWADAPPLTIHPRLREYGEAAPRGPLPRVRDRSEARALLARSSPRNRVQVEAARQRLATGRPMRLSELGELDAHAFGLFLDLLGEALAEQAGPDAAVERQTGDGLLRIRLEPLAAGQPRRDPHAARRLRRPRPSDHHHAARDSAMTRPGRRRRPSRSAGQHQRQVQQRGVPQRACAPC